MGTDRTCRLCKEKVKQGDGRFVWDSKTKSNYLFCEGCVEEGAKEFEYCTQFTGDYPKRSDVCPGCGDEGQESITPYSIWNGGPQHNAGFIRMWCRKGCGQWSILASDMEDDETLVGVILQLLNMKKHIDGLMKIISDQSKKAAQ